MQTNANRPAKKPFHTPQLLVYGDVGAITEGSGNVGFFDAGASMGNTKTGPLVMMGDD